MNLLALDTSTETLSVAVATGASLADLAVAGAAPPTAKVWHHNAPGGAQASTQLIPAVQQLLAQAGLQVRDLHAIAFGAGPGAFTGLRTACAVAQGLGFAANVPLLPVDTLLAVAEDARATLGYPARLQVGVLMDARMDELYTASYTFDSTQWALDMPVRLEKPENLTLAALGAASTLAGNGVDAYATRLPASTTAHPRVAAQPDARALLRLAPGLLARGLAVTAAQAMPVYIRNQVALTTAEREAAQATRLAAAHGTPEPATQGPQSLHQATLPTTLPTATPPAKP